jgi:hypothetical protein
MFMVSSLMPWFDAWRFAAETQEVIARRMTRFWLNDPTAGSEAVRMVTEKIAAAAESQAAVAAALMTGQSAKTVLRRATIPYRRRVRANRRRLG